MVTVFSFLLFFYLFSFYFHVHFIFFTGDKISMREDDMRRKNLHLPVGPVKINGSLTKTEIFFFFLFFLSSVGCPPCAINMFGLDF